MTWTTRKPSKPGWWLMWNGIVLEMELYYINKYPDGTLYANTIQGRTPLDDLVYKEIDLWSSAPIPEPKTKKRKATKK